MFIFVLHSWMYTSTTVFLNFEMKTLVLVIFGFSETYKKPYLLKRYLTSENQFTLTLCASFKHVFITVRRIILSVFIIRSQYFTILIYRLMYRGYLPNLPQTAALHDFCRMPIICLHNLQGILLEYCPSQIPILHTRMQL